MTAGSNEFVLRVRGLPWSCTESDLKKFFGDAGNDISHIKFSLNREGRPNGEAFVVLDNESSYTAALAKDHENMAHRYIEVFKSSRSEMDTTMQRQSTGGGGGPPTAFAADSVVRLRGLPFGCTKEEIANFFLGLSIAPNGIIMPFDPHTGKATGECYVCFTDRLSADKALDKHMKNIQHRYIEVFRSSQSEMEQAMGVGRGPVWDYGGRGRPYDRPGYPPKMLAYVGGYGGYGNGGAYEQGGAYGGYYDDGYGARAPGGGPMRAIGGRETGGWGGGRGAVALPQRRAPVAVAGGGYAPAGEPPSRFAVKMRGLPYRASEREIAQVFAPFNSPSFQFFSPLRVAKVTIMTEFGTGRPSGEARVEFYNQYDVNDALKRDRQHMGSRYVELFPDVGAAPTATAGGYPRY